MSEYVSREAAIEDFEQCNQKNSTWTPQRVKTLLMRIPAADVEPVRHGWWETFDSSYWRSTQYGVQVIDCVKIRCGLCGRGSSVRTNYCPNCGAKMDLEGETNDD